MLWFLIPYLIEVAIGFVGCSYFLVTWWRGVTNRWTLAAWDAGGWVVLLLAVFVLLLVNLAVYGPPEPTSVSRGIQGLLVYLVVDVVVVIRIAQWRRIRRAVESTKE